MPTIAERLARTARRESMARARRRRIRPDTVFYESFDGNGALCNPEAIFRLLVADPQYRRLRHVWSLEPGHEADRIRAEFAGDPRVAFVTRGTRAWVTALSTSGWLVGNATFPRWFSKRPGQTYLNTWHGVPLKAMGFDIGDPASRVANVLRTFLHADVLLSTGPYMTDRLYRDAHRLGRIAGARVLETGYPRIDHQFASDAEVEVTRAALREAGADVDGRQVVLYAPTWKGTNFSKPDDDAAALLATVHELQRRLGETHRVLLKTHQVVHAFARGRSEFEGILVPNDLPTNRVLAVADRLVTDYSSIFFDYLVSGRPVHFFVPDLADYAQYRGLYIEPDEWPGTVSTEVADVADAILHEAPVDTAAARERFVPHDDGGATRRVVDSVFGGVGDRGFALTAPGQEAVLLVVGGFPAADRAARIEAELARIDLDQVDVSVIVSDDRRPAFLAWQAALDSRVRVMVRQGEIAGSTVAQLARRLGLGRHTTLWAEEATRLFGSARFTRVVDLSGSPDFWATLARAVPVTSVTPKPDILPS